MNPIEKEIVSALNATFSPLYLEVVNESYMHSVPKNSETHFKVTLVSSEFEAKRSVQRHQAVYRCLAEQMANGVHALAIHTYTPAEWELVPIVAASPKCLGGGK